MQTIELNNGVAMPLLGLGVYQITDPSVCEMTVLAAIEAGYRLIDTASAYGNEQAVGSVIKKSVVPREELFITTKVWVRDTGYDNTKKAFELSMKEIAVGLSGSISDTSGSW